MVGVIELQRVLCGRSFEDLEGTKHQAGKVIRALVRMEGFCKLGDLNKGGAQRLGVRPCLSDGSWPLFRKNI
jgi:hypothetical protein